MMKKNGILISGWALLFLLSAAHAEKTTLAAMPNNSTGFPYDISFSLDTCRGKNTADARITLPVKVGDGLEPSLQLFAVDADGAEHFITATAMRKKYSSTTFILTGYFNEHSSAAVLSFRVKQVPGACATVQPGSGATLTAESEVKPRYELNEVLAPVWASTRMVNETVIPVSADGTAADGHLLFSPSGNVAVQNYALDKTYKAGIDYIVEGSTIRLTKNSSIPFLTQKQLYPDSADAPPGTKPAWKGGHVAFTERSFWNDHQLAVSYEHADTWSGPVPSQGKGRLSKTKQKLQAGLPLKVVLLGDSISMGASASGSSGQPPYLPGWGELFIKNLRQKYRSEITFVNPSLGGMVSEWGAKVAPFFAAPERPDICIIAFGMNDGRNIPADQYLENTRKIIESVRAMNRDAEFILVASMLPNENWRPLAPMDGYLKALKTLESDQVAVADVWSMHEYMLKTKRYCDMTGNHVNHPNDFMVRIYAQVTGALFDK